MVVSGEERVWGEAEIRSPHGQADKAKRVRRMFDAIAPTYGLVNSLFSGGRDRAWRRKTVALAGVTAGDRVLDIACGTGDLARAFRDDRCAPQVLVGCDFAGEMLAQAISGDGRGVAWAQADALQLPFGPGSFTITSCAFGVRNFQELDVGFREMHRVLAPGGRAVILEFTRPTSRLVRVAYEVYSSRIMPAAATWVSRDRTGAYRYLPRSVVSFDDAETLCRRLRNAGFDTATATPLTFGVVTVYVASKAR